MNPRRSLSQIYWGLAIALWGLGALGTWVWATNYELTADAERLSEIPDSWPTSSPLAPSTDRPTLLFFIHPRCPCTRASVHELERLLTGSRLTTAQLPQLIVVAYGPKNLTPEWTNSWTLARAAKLPHAEIFWDLDGIESRRFGAASSGAVRLYGPAGHLRFAGGITAARGHEGDNRGSELLRQQLVQPSTNLAGSTPVFGCQIYNDVESPLNGQQP